jgi:hypothetical protein
MTALIAPPTTFATTRNLAHFRQNLVRFFAQIAIYLGEALACANRE